jgi:integrase
MRLLLLTGARLREVLHAKWEYVDFNRALLNLPDSKTGKKSIIPVRTRASNPVLFTEGRRQPASHPRRKDRTAALRS